VRRFGDDEMNAECGSVCIRMLEDRGAPEQEGVQRKVDKAKANIEKDITAGRPPLIPDNVRNINDEHGNSRAYTLRRLAAIASQTRSKAQKRLCQIFNQIKHLFLKRKRRQRRYSRELPYSITLTLSGFLVLKWRPLI
jgi:hypothetical protein